MNTICQVLALPDDEVFSLLGYSSSEEVRFARAYFCLPSKEGRDRFRRSFRFIPDDELLMKREFSFCDIASLLRGSELSGLTYKDSLDILRKNISCLLSSLDFLRIELPSKGLCRSSLERLLHCRKLPSRSELNDVSAPLHLWYYKLYLDDLRPYKSLILSRFMQETDYLVPLRLYALDIQDRIGSESLFDSEESMQAEIKRLRALLGSVVEYMVLFAGRPEPEKPAYFRRLQEGR